MFILYFCILTFLTVFCVCWKVKHYTIVVFFNYLTKICKSTYWLHFVFIYRGVCTVCLPRLNYNNGRTAPSCGNTCYKQTLWKKQSRCESRSITIRNTFLFAYIQQRNSNRMIKIIINISPLLLVSKRKHNPI